MTNLLLIVALVLGTPGAQKNRDWKEAKIIDVKYDKKTDFQTGDPRTGGSLSAAIVVISWTYVVESEGVRWELREQDTKPTYETGEILKFAIDKKSFFFLDKKGKEKKGEVVGHKQVTPRT